MENKISPTLEKLLRKREQEVQPPKRMAGGAISVTELLRWYDELIAERGGLTS